MNEGMAQMQAGLGAPTPPYASAQNSAAYAHLQPPQTRPDGVLDGLERELRCLVDRMNSSAARATRIADRLLGPTPRPVDGQQSATQGGMPPSLHSISALIGAAHQSAAALEQEIDRIEVV